MSKLLILLNLLSLGVCAQIDHTMQLEEGASSPPASIELMAWVQGAWLGEGLGGLCEEVWSSAKGRSMLGTFRMIKNNKLMFSEFMEIAEIDGSLLLRLKHFGNDFVGWEEKDKYVEFKLVKVTDDTIYFDGLTYKKTGENSMEVYVVIDSGETTQEAKFIYTREDRK